VVLKYEKLASKIPFPEVFIKINPRELAVLSKFESKGSLICEIGSGNRRLSPSIINLDLEKGKNVDIVGDAHNLPFRDQTFDLVFVIAVLEHVKNPFTVAKEIHRILKTGGRVFADAPFLLPFHSVPRDYFRFTLDGLRELFKDFTEIDSGVSVGSASAFSWIFKEFAASLTDNLWISGLIRFVLRWIISPIKYLDYSLIKKKSSSNVALGFMYYGKKH